jgi:hypothetical protein
VCDCSDQAAHYHNLGPKLGASLLTRQIGWKQKKKERKKELELKMFNYLCGKIKRTLHNRSQQETFLKFYKALAAPAVFYGSECWTLTKQQLQQIEFSEIRFLRSMAGYRRRDKKRNTDFRQHVKVFSPGEKVNEYQHNYFEHILRMPTYRIPRNIFNYHLKGRRDKDRPPMRWIDQFA